MGDDTSYPMTIGQLSVWRDVEKKAPDRRWEVNLPFVWDIPAGHTVDEVWAALQALAMRHEGLRSAYYIDPVLGPRQRVIADNPPDAMATVRQGSIDVTELEEVRARRVQVEFDTATEVPWRAWIVTEDGKPYQVLAIVHHVAADGAGALIMQNDFGSLLAGESLPPAPTPRELALRQHGGDGASRLRAAERYWRRTFEAAPRQPATGQPQVALGAILHTGVPLPLAHQAAANLEVSLSSLLLAGYYRAARALTGNPAVLLFPMSANRFDAETASLVSSLNQWVPLLVEFDADEPLADMVKKLHWKAFNAFKNGIGDADMIVSVRAEFEAMQPPIDPGFNFNAILAPPGFPAPPAPFVPATIEWYDLDRISGPGFYLIARAISTISVVGRILRPGVDHDVLETFLMTMQDTLLEAVRTVHPDGPGTGPAEVPADPAGTPARG